MILLSECTILSGQKTNRAFSPGLYVHVWGGKNQKYATRLCNGSVWQGMLFAPAHTWTQQFFALGNHSQDLALTQSPAKWNQLAAEKLACGGKGSCLIPSLLLFSAFHASAFFRNRICGRMLDHAASKQNMSDSCTVFSSILSFAGPSNGWQPMVTPADWEEQMETKPVLFSGKCFLYNKLPCIANTMFTGRDDCGCRNRTFVFSNSAHLHVWEIHFSKDKTCLVFGCAAACWIMLCQNITCLTAALSSVPSYHPPGPWIGGSQW